MYDYKYVMRRKQAKPLVSRPTWHWHGVIFFILAAVLILLLVESKKTTASLVAPNASTTESQIVTSDTVPDYDWEMESYEIQLPPVVSADPAPVKFADARQPEWQTFTVRPGYNLAIICSRAGVKKGEVHSIMQLGKSVAVLHKLYPNDKIHLKIEPDGRLAALQYDIDHTKQLLVSRIPDHKAGELQFKAETINRSLETRTAHISAVINNSLYVAAQRAGLPIQITSELANLFGWDIDFTLQVRKGDRFTVVYENYYQDGDKITGLFQSRRNLSSTNRIIAAEFVNNGTIYRAVRYTDPNGHTDYYTPEGSTIRKTFMRNPVDARVSSPFNPKRRHPLLKKTRPHRGVDYAAPRGTAIKAVGDGKIVFKGRQGGYGRTIIIQHGQRYSTLYAHLSNYARQTAKGRRIKQGQVIGYVGKSGLATGNHLHYEFRIDGVHHNPLTVKHPSVAPIAKQLMADFVQQTQARLAQLDTIKRINLAADHHRATRTRI